MLRLERGVAMPYDDEVAFEYAILCNLSTITDLCGKLIVGT